MARDQPPDLMAALQDSLQAAHEDRQRDRAAWRRLEGRTVSVDMSTGDNGDAGHRIFACVSQIDADVDGGPMILADFMEDNEDAPKPLDLDDRRYQDAKNAVLYGVKGTCQLDVDGVDKEEALDMAAEFFRWVEALKERGQ